MLFKKSKRRFRANPTHQAVQTTGSTANIVNFFSNLFKRSHRWLQQQKDVSLFHIYLWKLPLKISSKTLSAIIELIHSGLIKIALSDHRFRRYLSNHFTEYNKLFFIIVLPNSLHLVIQCLQLIPKNISLFLLTNGTRRWENNYLRRHYSQIPQFHLSGIPGKPHAHGRALNFLFKNCLFDFGILDYDLFLFDPTIFEELTLSERECAIGGFKIQNMKSNLVFPTTHFLFFNSRIIRDIMNKYRIGAQEYSYIPRHLKSKLGSIGIGYDNFLKEYLLIFDTLNLIWAMAIYDGYSIQFVNPKDHFHLGKTGGNGLKNPFIHFAELKLLNLPENEAIKKKYQCLPQYWMKPSEVLQNIPKPQRVRFALQIDNLINRLKSNQRT